MKNRQAFSGSVSDPDGAAPWVGRVARGGSWYFHARQGRSAHHYYGLPGSRSDGIGFRAARTLP